MKIQKTISICMLVLLCIACKKDEKTLISETEFLPSSIDTTGYFNFKKTLVYEFDQPLQYFVHNNFAVMVGYIDSNTPSLTEKLFVEHPEVKNLIMLDVPGSVDDVANLQTAKMVYERKMNTIVPRLGMIASGGTDFFLAGHYRCIDPFNTRVGVHSWSDGEGAVATDYPVGHELHLPYIDYYVAVGIDQQLAEDFYYYTINAAPADDIHWMTSEELLLYQFENKE